MAKKSRSTFKKRQREVGRQQRQQDKAARRLVIREQARAATPGSAEGDPDLAGIVPGPQPLPEEVLEFIQKVDKGTP